MLEKFKEYSRSGFAEEAAKFANNTGGQFAKSLIGKKIVARAFDLKQCVRGRDQLQREFHFRDRPERIARAVDEKSRLAQLREMRSAKLIWFFRWMQRVREKQQTVDEAGIF